MRRSCTLSTAQGWPVEAAISAVLRRSRPGRRSPSPGAPGIRVLVERLRRACSLEPAPPPGRLRGPRDAAARRPVSLSHAFSFQLGGESDEVGARRGHPVAVAVSGRAASTSRQWRRASATRCGGMRPAALVTRHQATEPRGGHDRPHPARRRADEFRDVAVAHHPPLGGIASTTRHVLNDPLGLVRGGCHVPSPFSRRGSVVSTRRLGLALGAAQPAGLYVRDPRENAELGEATLADHTPMNGAFLAAMLPDGAGAGGAREPDAGRRCRRRPSTILVRRRRRRLRRCGPARRPGSPLRGCCRWAPVMFRVGGVEIVLRSAEARRVSSPSRPEGPER